MENTTTDNFFEKNFNYGSLVSLLIFILGVYIMYLILKKDYSQAFFYMLTSFIIYIINNIKQNLNESTTAFNEELENLASFFTFTVNLILFGIVFYKGDTTILFLILFFAICSVLSMTRSSVSNTKNSVGFPIALNGLFFPLIYYVYVFYLQSPGSSIFLVYYLVIAILSISKNNYIEFEDIIEKQVRNTKRENNLEKEILEENNLEEEFIEKTENNEDKNEDSNLEIEENNDVKNIEKQDLNTQKEKIKEEEEELIDDFNELELENYNEEEIENKKIKEDKSEEIIDKNVEIKPHKKHKGLISFIAGFFKKKDKIEKKEEINNENSDDFDKFPGYIDESKNDFDELRDEKLELNLDENKENIDEKSDEDFDKFPDYVDESENNFKELKVKRKGLISFIAGFFKKKDKVKKEKINNENSDDFDKFPGYVDESDNDFNELRDDENDEKKHKTITDDNKII